MKLENRRFRSVSALVDAVVEDRQEATRLKEGLAERKLVSALLLLRCQAQLTQAQMAERLGCSQPTVSNLENGRDASVTVGTLVDYAKAMGLELRIEFAPRQATAAVRLAYHAACLKEEIRRIGALVEGDADAERSAMELFRMQAESLAETLAVTLTRYSVMRQATDAAQVGELLDVCSPPGSFFQGLRECREGDVVGLDRALTADLPTER